MTTDIRYFFPLILSVCLWVALISAPALGAGEYLGGEPVLVASLEGSHEFLPGSDATLVVVIENRATNDFEVFPSGKIVADEVPTTARLLTVDLGTGDAPLFLRTDPQMVGDLPANSRVKVPFEVKFFENASGGSYTLPLSLKYRSFLFADQRGSETVAYQYANSSAIIPLGVEVTPRVSIRVLGTEAEELTSGNEGVITLTLVNDGSLSGNEAITRIFRHQESPIIPVVGTSYIGVFAPGDTVKTQFKIQVNDAAQASTYPLDVVVEYLDPQGDLDTTDPVTIGVPVKGSIEFKILSDDFTMPRGDTGEIEVSFRNTGPVPVRSAQARISAVDPFSSTRDIASLGDLDPGEEGKAVFVISVDKAATVKDYSLEAEVRYRDALDNRLVSDPMKIRVRVVERSGIDAILKNPLYLTIIAAVLIGAGYFAYTRKKGGIRKKE